MRQGIQSTIDHDKIRNYGCYFLSIVQKAVLEGAHDKTEYDLVELYNACVKRRTIDEDCFISEPIQLYEMAGGIKQYYEVGTAYGTPPKGIYVACLKKHLPMKTYTHFVLENDGIRWDPLDPAREAAKGYEVFSYRYWKE